MCLVFVCDEDQRVISRQPAPGACPYCGGMVQAMDVKSNWRFCFVPLYFKTKRKLLLHLLQMAASEVAASAATTTGVYIKGLMLALSSSCFIGANLIVKKKGLKKAGASGLRAVIVGEIANFAAYAFAPAILVTLLGALSNIISAVLEHIILREKLHIFGVLGCVLRVVGSTTIVLHAPQEREFDSVKEVWDLAMEPASLFYAALVMTVVLILILHYVPQYGQTHILFYIGVCSIVISLSVTNIKTLGIALKLTLSGMNQLVYPETWGALLW